LKLNVLFFNNACQVLASDIFEFMRVYGIDDIPNNALQELIQLNKTMYLQEKDTDIFDINRKSVI